MEKLTHDYLFDGVIDFKEALSEIRGIENNISDIIDGCDNLEYIEAYKKSSRKNDKFCKEYCPIYDTCKSNYEG